MVWVSLRLKSRELGDEKLLSIPSGGRSASLSVQRAARNGRSVCCGSVLREVVTTKIFFASTVLVRHRDLVWVIPSTASMLPRW